MDQESMLREHGLVGAIRMITMIRSEETAFFGHIFDNNESVDICLMELQSSVDSLISQMKSRYGVSAGDRVVISCNGHAVAEAVACVACASLQSTFVPVDGSWIHYGNRLKDIVEDCGAVVAIVVASSDSDCVVRTMAAAGIHKCILLQSDGNIVYEENWQSICTSLQLISAESSVDDQGGRDSTPPPLYVLYTSGSTGKPKGVMGTTKGLVNRLIWQSRRFPWHQIDPFDIQSSPDGWDNDDDDNSEDAGGGSSSDRPCESQQKYEYPSPKKYSGDDVVCRRTPLVFVDSIAEIFGALTAGKQLFIPPRNESTGVIEMSKLAEALSVNRVTHVTFLPSQLHALLEDLESQVCKAQGIEKLTGSEILRWHSLRLVFVSGESCRAETIRLFDRLRKEGLIPSYAHLVNLYGSTEVAGDVGVCVLCEGGRGTINVKDQKEEMIFQESTPSPAIDFVPISSGIIDGNVFYIAKKVTTCNEGDEGGNLTYESVAEGEEGELLISGVQLADGYVSSNGHTSGSTAMNGRSDADANTFKFIEKPASLRNGYHSDPISIFDADLINTKGDQYGKEYRRIYCTGDLVRVVSHPVSYGSCPDENDKIKSICIQLVGRNDLQVKARGGIRINLQEMESVLFSALSSHSEKTVGGEGQAHVICTAYEQSSVKSVIVAFVSPTLLPIVSGDASSEINMTSWKHHTTAATRHHLLTKCNTPTFFLPDVVVPISRESGIWRTSVTGKIDRNRYKQEAISYAKEFLSSSGTEDKMSAKESSAASSELKSQFLSTLLPLLPLMNADRFQGDEVMQWSFTALGGDSMNVHVALWRLHQKFDVNFDFIDLVDSSLGNLLEKILSCGNDENSLRKRKECDAGESDRTILGSSIQVAKRGRPDTEENSIVSKVSPRRVVTVNGDELLPDIQVFATRQTSKSTPSLLVDVGDDTRLRVEWTVSLGRCIDASPLAVRGNFQSPDSRSTVVFGASHGGVVSATDVVSGKELWRTQLGMDIHIEGSIVCGEDFPLVVLPIKTESNDSSLNILHSFPLFVASYQAQDKDGHVSHDLSVEDCDKNSSCGKLWCLDASDGSILWHSGTVIRGEAKGQPTLAKIPLMPNGDTGSDSSQRQPDTFYAVLVASHDGNVYVFDTCTGMLLGSYQCNIGSFFASPVILAKSDPIVTDDSESSRFLAQDICLCSTRGHLLVLSIAMQFSSSNHTDVLPEDMGVKFRVKWTQPSHDGAPIFGTPLIFGTTRAPSEKLLYATLGGSVCCLSTVDGSSFWTHVVVPKLGDRCSIFTSPVAITFSAPPEEDIGGESIASASGKWGWVVLGGHDGCVRALSLFTGELSWEIPLGAVVYSTPQIIHTNTPAQPENTIVVACTTAGDICLMRYDSSALPEKKWCIHARTRLRGEIFSSPLFLPAILLEENQTNADMYENGALVKRSKMQGNHRCDESDRELLIGAILIGCRDDCLHCIKILSSH